MGDVICQWCGEPWEYYHLKHEMESGELVLSGDGCPACEWGSKKDEPEFVREWRRSLVNGTDEDLTKYL